MHQINKLFGEKLHMVNIGVETFYQDMLSQKEAAPRISRSSMLTGNP